MEALICLACVYVRVSISVLLCLTPLVVLYPSHHLFPPHPPLSSFPFLHPHTPLLSRTRRATDTDHSHFNVRHLSSAHQETSTLCSYRPRSCTPVTTPKGPHSTSHTLWRSLCPVGSPLTPPHLIDQRTYNSCTVTINTATITTTTITTTDQPWPTHNISTSMLQEDEASQG